MAITMAIASGHLRDRSRTQLRVLGQGRFQAIARDDPGYRSMANASSPVDARVADLKGDRTLVRVAARGARTRPTFQPELPSSSPGPINRRTLCISVIGGESDHGGERRLLPQSS